MKKVSLICVVIFYSILAFSQESNISLSSGSSLVFKNGIENWSEPQTINVKDIKDDDVAPLSIRIRFKKRVVLACHYEIEVTNLSENQSVSIKLSTGYTDYNGNDVVESFNLKPKATGDGKIIYGEGLKKPKSDEDCITCSWNLHFFNTKIK